MLGKDESPTQPRKAVNLMRDRLIKFCNEIVTTSDEITPAEFADYLLANGVIVPPCKVGDTVWYLNRYHSIAMYKNAVYEAKVVRVYVENGNILCLSIQIKNEYGTTEYPRITEIGKTVFLTREEAEAALNMRKDGEGENEKICKRS